MTADSFIKRFDDKQNKIQSFGFVIAACICVLLSVVFTASNISKSGQKCEIQTDSKINPNSAPVASLMRLPGIGIVRAGAIVALRDSLIAKDGQSRVFKTADDLQKVRGIGPKTTKNISEWLKFE